VVYLSDQGLIACDGERFECLSTRVYNEASKVGEWAYEIAACKAASEADTDNTYFGCTAIGQRLWVWYRTGASTRRMMCLDFSASRATSGMAQFLDDSGTPFGWSAPLTIPLTCVNQFHDGTNEKLYGLYEGMSGRFDQFDVGVSDYVWTGAAYGYQLFSTDVYFKADNLGTDRKKSLRRLMVRYKNAEAVTTSSLWMYRDEARTKSSFKDLAVTAATKPERIARFDPTLAGQSGADVVEFRWRVLGVTAEAPELWEASGAVDILEPSP
jgi:hypothetical protein